MRLLSAFFLMVATTVILSGCETLGNQPAHIVAGNVGVAAENFTVVRHIVVRNAHTDALIAEITGYCAIWVDRRPFMVVVCAEPDGTFTKHWYGVENAVYSIEQPTGVAVSTERRDR